MLNKGRKGKEGKKEMVGMKGGSGGKERRKERGWGNGRWEWKRGRKERNKMQNKVTQELISQETIMILDFLKS